MKSRSESISISQVVKSTLCLIATVVVAWPVVAQNYASWTRGAYNNAKRVGTASLGYAADWDEVLPRMDNNGSCLYGSNPCNYPDWGDYRYPNNNPAFADQGKFVMYAGAISPYFPTAPTYDPSMGPTDYEEVFASSAKLGLVVPSTGYNASHQSYYELAIAQFAVNILGIDHGSTTASSVNNRPLAPKGRLHMFVHPQTTILATMESAWDWDIGADLNIGDIGVWPSWGAVNCYSRNSDGWTRYSIPKPRQNPREVRGHGMEFYGDPNRATLNPNLRGLSMFLFVDGHAEPLTYPVAERCVPVPGGGPWFVTANVTFPNYYPNWVPEIAP